MTTPGPVAAQVAVPTKIGSGGRDTSAKGEAAAPADGEAGFGEVLTKLQSDDASKAGARRGERASVGRQDAAQQPTADDGTGRSSIDLVLDSLAVTDQQPSADQRPDATTASAPASNPVADIIAAALAPIQPPAQPPQAATNEKPGQGANAATAAMALLDDKAAATPTSVPDPAPENAAAESAAAQTMPAPSDPALAHVAARAGAPDKGKSDRKSSGPTDAPPAPATFAAAAAPSADTAVAADTTQPMKASVLRQEAHFAPVASTAATSGTAEREAAGSGADTVDGENGNTPSVDALLSSADDMQTSAGRPAQQIADRILTEAGTAPEAADRAGLTPDQPGMRPVLKVLHIQLQPADMGTVTVRMELKDAELTLQVEADRAGTADLIRNDQDTLSGLLRASGYNVDVGSVRVVEADRSGSSQQSLQNGTQSGFQSSPQSHSGASERQGQNQQGGAGTSSADTTPKLSRNDSNETNANRAGRGLYL